MKNKKQTFKIVRILGTGEEQSLDTRFYWEQARNIAHDLEKYLGWDVKISPDPVPFRLNRCPATPAYDTSAACCFNKEDWQSFSQETQYQNGYNHPVTSQEATFWRRIAIAQNKGLEAVHTMQGAL